MKLRFAFVFALLATQHLFAANPGKALVNEVKQYGRDAADIVRAPLEWDHAMWRKVAIISAADAAAFAADESIANFVQRNRNHAERSICEGDHAFRRQPRLTGFRRHVSPRTRDAQPPTT